MKLAATDDAMLTKKYSSGAEFFRGQEGQQLHTKIRIKCERKARKQQRQQQSTSQRVWQRRQREEQTTRL
jgi:hypothetical protein